MKPEEHQPSGTLNMSRIDTATLDLEFSITSVTKGGVTQSSHPFSINSSTGMLSNSSAFPSSDIGDIYRINVQVSDNVNSANPLTATGYVDVEIAPQLKNHPGSAGCRGG